MGWLMSAGQPGPLDGPLMRIGSPSRMPGWSLSTSSRTTGMTAKVWQSVLANLTEQHDNPNQESNHDQD